MIKPSKLFEDKILNIVSELNNNWLSVELSIGSFEDPTFHIEPFHIDYINISHLYTINLMPNIQLVVKVRIDDVLSILNNLRSLYVRLKIEYIDPLTLEKDLTLKPFQKIYNLHIPNLEDLYKKYNINQLKSSDENATLDQHAGLIPLGLQLLEQSEFSLRKRQINAIFSQVTIKDVILFIAYNLGFKKINYIDKFNQSVYQNFHIPINYGKFDTIFTYIHNRYGIYDKGFNYFSYNDILYLYPAYDFLFERNNESILHIYKVAPKSYNGLKNYHKFIDNDLYIVSNSELINHKLSATQLENVGTNVVFMDTRSLIDNARKVNPDGTVDIKNEIVNLSSGENNKILDKSVSIDYSKPSLNLYENSSKIAERNTEIILIEWSMARPFSTIPGNRVKFYYEHETGIQKRDGIIENVEYQMTKINQTATNLEDFFVCNAKLQIRLNQI